MFQQQSIEHQEDGGIFGGETWEGICQRIKGLTEELFNII
jgi:hypothetical protein